MMARPFPALPRPETKSGSPRKIGVEIEFSGLSEDETAEIVRQRFGGKLSKIDAHHVSVEDTEIGTVEIVLDTALRKLANSKVLDAGLSLARAVIPVEIVTEPLTLEQLEPLDSLREDLRNAGAHGTADAMLLGFGVHFNIEIVSAEDPHTARTILAFALLEDWLRDNMQIDQTRRVLPFVDPWPRSYATALAEKSVHLYFDEARSLYREHVDSRNHGLDLLPIFKDHDAALFEEDFPDHGNVKGRPAFHYRLPDCRIDEPAWSLRKEWINWCRVERLAADEEQLIQLAEAFVGRDAHLFNDRSSWAHHCSSVLRAEAAF
jgi:hypothetical protein